MATAIASRMEGLLPDGVAGSFRSRAALVSNLPYWGAALAAIFLVVAIVIRPCAQLLHITLMHLWDGAVAAGGSGDGSWNLLLLLLPWGLGGGGKTGNTDPLSSAAMAMMMTPEEEALGCSVGLAMATHALRYMDMALCPIQTMEGNPCILPPLSQQSRNQQQQRQNQQKQQHRRRRQMPYASTATTSSNNNNNNNITTVCPSAALEFQGPTRRMIDWFLPFHQNGSVTCAHTRWFNVTSGVNAIVTTTMFGKPLVLWYPSIASGDGGGNSTTKTSTINNYGHKLSLIVFSHISQKEELLTYRSVINISYLTPMTMPIAPPVPGVEAESPPLPPPKGEAAMARKSIRLTGGIAHCVQWLLDVYGT